MVPLMVCAMSVAMVGVAEPAAATPSSTMKTVPVQQLSNRVLKLIKLVEGSTLPCQTRNTVVRRLRELDDSLLSGRRTAAQALAVAWRQDAWSKQASRVISPELGSSIQNRLGTMEGQIGIGWPVKPGPTRHWKPLPTCETSASGGVGSYDPAITDPASDIKFVIKALLGLIPKVGPILGGLVDLLWPNATMDLFQQLVDQAIYGLVAADLQGLEDLLIGLPSSWETQVAQWQQDCANPPANDPNICATEANDTLWVSFQSKLDEFIASAAMFQQNTVKDYRLDLLPLYAQYENLYLSFLRDAMLLHDQYWSKVSGKDTHDLAGTSMAYDLNPTHTDRGIGYVNAIYQMGLAEQPAPSASNWNTRNAFVRDNTLNVLDFRDTWKYLDPRAYPDGVPGGVKLTRMIYSDVVADVFPTTGTPSPSRHVDGPLKEISVWTRTVATATEAISSVQATSPPLLGPAQSAELTGDTAQAVNSAHYYNLAARGPIIQAKAQYAYSNYRNSAIGFVFARGGSEVWQGTHSSNSLIPVEAFDYDGEVLATVEALGSVYTFYGDIAGGFAFGFRYADSFDVAGEVIGVGSGKCLDVHTFIDGSPAWIQPCSNSSSPTQVWTYDPGLQQLSVTNHAGWSDTDPTNTRKQCLDTAGGGTATGTPVVLNPCDDGAVKYDANGNPVVSSQRWTLDAVGAGIAKITNVKSGLVLAVYGNGTADQTPLQLNTYSAAASGQQWHAADPMTGEIHGIGSGRCLNVPNGSTASGTQVQIYDCNATAAQQWTYKPTTKELVYAKAPTMCLDARSGGTAPGTAVQIYACNGTAAQQWTLHGDGSVISNDKSGLLLDVKDGKTADGTLVQLNSSNGGQGQLWSRTSSQGGTVYSVGGGKCLDLPSSNNGTQAVINVCSPQFAMQTWTYHPLAQTYTVAGTTGPKCLDAAAGGTTAGTAVVINDCTGAASQRWSRDFSNATITNINSGLVLDLTGGGILPGTPVQLSSPGNPIPNTQKWVWSLS
jgi:hypothetical protein